MHTHTHTHTRHIQLWAFIVSAGIYCLSCGHLSISCFHRNSCLLHLQCSDSAVVPSFAVLTSCTQCISGRLSSFILIESTYTGLQCLLPCCMGGFVLYAGDGLITLETLLSCIPKLTKCEQTYESHKFPYHPSVLAFVSTLQVRDYS